MTKGESNELKSRISDFSFYKQSVECGIKRIIDVFAGIVSLVPLYFYHQQGNMNQVFLRQVHMDENNKLFEKYIIYKNIKHKLQIGRKGEFLRKIDANLRSDFKIPLKTLEVVSLGKEAIG